MHKSLISKIWQLTNSLQSIWGKGQVGQEAKVPQMSTVFSHQNSNQKKALEAAMEPSFYQTRCRLPVLRKLLNIMQDLVCGHSVKSNVQPGGAQQIETCWIGITFSVQKKILQVRSLPLLWPGFALRKLLGQGKGEEQARTCFVSALTAHRLCWLEQLSSRKCWSEESRTWCFPHSSWTMRSFCYREVFHRACTLQKHDFFKN